MLKVSHSGGGVLHTVYGYLPLNVNAQTGTTYTVAGSDVSYLVTFSNASPVAVTLPQATGGFGAGAFLYVQNVGAGLVTITPTTSKIDGASSLALATNQGALLVSDGTNWATMRGIDTLARSSTVAGLPSASSSGAGARSFVTDANATTFLSIAAGGGANKVPVVSDGTNWLIG